MKIKNETIVINYIELLNNCKTKEEFKTIWDPDKFSWYMYSDCLAINCQEYFNIWWDENKFNWVYSYYLAKYCNRYFDVWWNEDKYKWGYSHLLCQYCQKHKDVWIERYVIKKLKGDIYEYKNIEEFRFNNL